MLSSLRPCLSLFAAVLLLFPSSFAFDTPLSDTAVRQAYFLGQRRDEKVASFLDKYTQRFAPPKTGPQVASITLLTPFAVLVRRSSERFNYSAQQAEKEHRGDDEMVAITIEILLTQSYGAVIPKPTGSHSGSPVGYQLRSPDFWKDIAIQVFDGEKKLSSATPTGEPHYSCDGEGGCGLFGATLHLEFPAKLFTSDSATIEVDPPQGDPVVADFDLASLR
jgi:hypothetical protein